MSEEGTLSQLIMVGAGMRTLLEAMSCDVTVSEDYKREIRRAMRQWDTLAAQLGRPPRQSMSVIALVETCNEPAAKPAALPEQLERPVTASGRPRRPRASADEMRRRQEVALLLLNQRGQAKAHALANAMDVPRVTPQNMLDNAPAVFSQRPGSSDWYALRVSALWTDEHTARHGQPRFGTTLSEAAVA